MRLRNINMAGMILLVLAFTVGMAGAIENGTANETPTVNVTGTPTVILQLPQQQLRSQMMTMSRIQVYLAQDICYTD